MPILGNLMVLLGLQAADYLRGLDEVRRKTSSTTGEVSISWKDGVEAVSKSIEGIGFAAVTIDETMNKAFEFGREGAVISQTRESFARLLQTIGAAPDLLEKLMTASKGVIDDEEIMASTTRALAGQKGEYVQLLAQEAPVLMEGAKAYAKLNPSLGDTASRYDLIMTALSRNRPMMLEQAGIHLNLTQVYKAYADSIGVAVDELDEEQQKTAVLRAVEDDLKVVLEQVGGNTDAATDSFDRFKTASGELGDEIKARLYPPLSSAFEAMTLLITASDQYDKAFAARRANIEQTSKVWEDYAKAEMEALDQQGYFTKIVDGAIEVFKHEGQRTYEVTQQFDLLTQANFDSTKAIEAQDIATTTYNQTLAKAAIAAGDGAGYTGVMGRLTQRTQEQTAAITQLTEKRLRDEEATRKQAEAEAEHARKLAEEILKQQEAIIETGNLAAVQAGIEGQLQEARNKSREEMEKQTSALIFQKASVGLNADATLELARALGMISENDYAVFSTLERLRQQFDSDHDGAIEASEGIEQYIQSIVKLDQTVKGMMAGNNPFGAGYTTVGAGMVWNAENIGNVSVGGLAAAVGLSGVNQTQIFLQPLILTGDRDQAVQALTPIFEEIQRKRGR